MTTNPENTNENVAHNNQAPAAPQYNPNNQYNAGYTQNGYGVDPMAQQTAKSSNTMGLWSIILSCAGFLFGLLAFVGVGLGIAANSKAKQAIAAGIPADQTGKGKAKAGIIIGIVMIILIIFVVVWQINS